MTSSRSNSLIEDATLNDIAGIEAPVIDSHAHIFSRDNPVAPDAWTRLDYEFTADDYLATLDRHGVFFGVLSALSISGYYNDFTLAALRRHKRLRSTVILPPDTDRYTMERMRNDGVVGIRLQLTRRQELPDFTTEEFQLLLRRVRDLGWHVQVTLEGPLLPPLLAVLEPTGVNIVIDHFGHPDPKVGVACKGFQAMMRSAAKGRTWIKLSGGFRLAGTDSWRSDPNSNTDALTGELARMLLAEVGPDRLLWGSDCPFVGYERRISYAQTLRDFYRWVPDPGLRRRISDTALRLYFS